MENVVYIENARANSTTTSAEILPEDIYTVNIPYETNNPVVQEPVSIDIDKIFENQRQMLEYQKQLMDSNTAILGHLQSLINVENKVIQQLSGLSVQLEDAVAQITGIDNTGTTEVAYLKDCKSFENTPFSIKRIETPKELDDLEKKLSDIKAKQQLKRTYSILCSKGGKGVDCAYALIDIMFARTFICQCSWSGGSRSENLKVPLKGYKHTLSFFWEMIHFWDEKYTIKDNEIFFKTILKNAHKRKLAKCERASTSRKRSKPCQIELQETVISEIEISDKEHVTQERNIEIDEAETYIREEEYPNTPTEKRNQTENENEERTQEN